MPFLTGLAQQITVVVGGKHNLILSLGLGDGNARTRGLKLGCPVKDGKINNNNL